jgi:hypothetical protein
MILRAALLLILVIVALRLLARWRRLTSRPRGGAIEAARKCPDCGAWVMAGEPCPCQKRTA